MWNKTELKTLKKLSSPRKIQDFLDKLNYNTDGICRSPKEVMRTRKAHCMDGALFAATALEQLCYQPLIMDLRAVNDDDHVIALFKEKGLWGAVAKSNTTLLRYRDPIYKNLRELAMSYFFAYFNTKGDMSLQEYSRSFNLKKISDWQFSKNNLEYIGEKLDKTRHYKIISVKNLHSLPKAPDYLMNACFLGSNPNGLFKPK